MLISGSSTGFDGKLIVRLDRCLNCIMGWLCGLRECDRVLRGRADRRNMSASVDMLRNVEIHSDK